MPTEFIRIPVCHGRAGIDLRHTLTCGQVFRWGEEADGWWVGTMAGTALALRSDGTSIEARQSGEPLGEPAVASFLALDHDLARVHRRIGTDRAMRKATEAVPGLRIVRQDPLECLAGFICSAWNNIPKIQRSTSELCRRWGQPLTLDLDGETRDLAAFPSAERLAAVSEAELRETGLGFRAPNLGRAACLIADGSLQFEEIRAAPYPEALRLLQQVPGVGHKVADCVLLFSLDHPEAFPVDVWVWRVMRELYGRQLQERLPDLPPDGGAGLPERAYRIVQQFAWDRWGKQAGYAQQYLFTARRWGLL